MKTIVIADDNNASREMLAIAISRAGYEVIQAHNGSEAYNAICLHEPDAVILDINMPILDGLTVCQMMKQNAKTAAIPVACMTACKSSEHLRDTKAAGVKHCWFKPLNLDRVLKNLASMI